MAASFPGEALDESTLLTYPWRDISFVFEVKPEEKDDPFYDWKRGDSNDEKIMRYTDEVRLPHTRRVFYSQMC